jgi:hypothetical protein
MLDCKAICDLLLRIVTNILSKCKDFQLASILVGNFGDMTGSKFRLLGRSGGYLKLFQAKSRGVDRLTIVLIDPCTPNQTTLYAYRKLDELESSQVQMRIA